MPERETYRWLVALLDEHGADYHLLEHDPVGVTETVSRLRGNPLEQAAKCLMLMVRLDKRTRRHVLAVVPGDRRVDFGRIKRYYGATYAAFCDPTTAERLARAVPGTVLPFAVDEEVQLVVDPEVLAQPRLYFNAGVLDRSVSLATSDYERIARPVVHPIVQPTDRP